MSSQEKEIMDVKYVDMSNLTVSTTGTIQSFTSTVEEEHEEVVSDEPSTRDYHQTESRTVSSIQRLQNRIISQWRDNYGNLNFKFDEPAPGRRWASFKRGRRLGPVASYRKKLNLWEKKLKLLEDSESDCY